MVATRSAARKVQGEPAATANTLKAPPKRAAKRRAEPEPTIEPEPVPELRPATRRTKSAVTTAPKPATKRAVKSISKPASKPIEEEPKQTVAEPDVRSAGRPATKRGAKSASALKPATESSTAPANGLITEPVADISIKPVTRRAVKSGSKQPAKAVPKAASKAAPRTALESAPKRASQPALDAPEEGPKKRTAKVKVATTSEATTTASKRATRSNARKTETKSIPNQDPAHSHPKTGTTQVIGNETEELVQSATQRTAAKLLMGNKSPQLKAVDVSTESKKAASKNAFINATEVDETAQEGRAHENHIAITPNYEPTTSGTGDDVFVSDESVAPKSKGDEAGGYGTGFPGVHKPEIRSPADEPLADKEPVLQKAENEATGDEKTTVQPYEQECGAQEEKICVPKKAVQHDFEGDAVDMNVKKSASPPRLGSSDQNDHTARPHDTEPCPSFDGNNTEPIQQDELPAVVEFQQGQQLERIREHAASPVFDQSSPAMAHTCDEGTVVTAQAAFLIESAVVEESEDTAMPYLASTSASMPGIASAGDETTSSSNVLAPGCIVHDEIPPLDAGFDASLNPETGATKRGAAAEQGVVTCHGTVSPIADSQSWSTDERVVATPAIQKNKDIARTSFDNDISDPKSSKPKATLLAFPIPTLSFRSETLLPRPDSPIKSAMKSPKKCNNSPKKNVTFSTHSSSPFQKSLLVADGPLSNTVFYLDVNSRGKSENHIFTGLLEDLGARIVPHWDGQYTVPTHCLFKDGSTETLQKIKATKGAVKCVNVGFVLDCEKFNRRVDESDYSVSLLPVDAQTPSPAPKRIAYTPARTPSRLFEFRTPSTMLSTPTTPNSSEWERSIVYDDGDDKENTEPSPPARPVQQSCPPKAQGKFSWLSQSPVKSMTAARPLLSSAARKRRFETFGGITMAPPKKPRFL